MKSWDITRKEDLDNAVREILEMGGRPGGSATVLALHGDLGAGKTTFVQTLAVKLGVSETVISPTFVIMKKYQTKNDHFKVLVHIDAYRLNDVDELAILGFADELIRNDTIICIEWAEKVANLLPDTTTHLRFSLSVDGKRELSLE